MIKSEKIISVFLSAVLLFSMLPEIAFGETSEVSQNNLVINGTFDENVQGWGASSGSGRTVSWSEGGADGTGGCVSVKYTADTTLTNGSPGVTQQLKLDREVWYEFSYKVKIDNFDPSNPKTPKSAANSTLYLLEFDELDDRNPLWHVYGQAAQYANLKINDYVDANNKAMCSVDWTEIKGYFKYSGPEAYGNANCGMQPRVGNSANTTFSYFFDDVKFSRVGSTVANGGFENTGYSEVGAMSRTNGYTTFKPWITPTSSNVVFETAAAHTGEKGANVKLTGETTSIARALSQYVSMDLGKSYDIGAWLKIADGYTLPADVTEVKAQILLTHETFATDVATGVRSKMDCGTEYISTVDIKDKQWHKLSKIYASSWDIASTSKGKAINPYNANSTMYFRVTAVKNGVEDRNIVIPYYVDDVSIAPHDIFVRAVDFADSRGGLPIEQITETDSLYANVAIANETGNDKLANIIMAGYDSKNRLVNVVTEPVQLPANITYLNLKSTKSLNLSCGVTRAMISVWDENFGVMQPLTKEKRLLGDYNKINNSLNKLYNTGKLSIGFIGGSITAGSGASSGNGYAYQTISWFKNRFSQYNVEGHVAGVGGTGSDLGTCRLQEELLVYNPDLVFVEFAVNDGGAAEANLSTEGIIRQIKAYNPNADVVLINTFQIPFMSNYNAGTIPDAVLNKNIVANYYGLGSINVGKALYYTIQDEVRTEPGYYMADNAHPKDAGHTHYKNTIAAYMEKMIANANLSVESSVLKAPLNANYFTGSVVDLASSGVVLTGNWEKLERKTGNHYIYQSKQTGNSIEYTFNGTGVGLYMRVAPDTGIFNYQIDGGITKAVDTSDIYSRDGMDRIFYKFLEKDLTRGEHKLKVWVSGQKNTAATDYYLSVGALLIKD